MQIIKRCILGLILILVATCPIGCSEDELDIKTMKESEGADTGTEKGSDISEVGAEKDSVDSGTVNDNKPDSVAAAEGSETGKDVDSDMNTDDDSTFIYVYICGAVKEEGVYQLPAYARVQDALDKAGGYTEDAAHGYVNLAEKLTDGERIYIPTVDETEGIDVNSYDSGSADSSSSSGNESGQNGSKLININTADKEALKTLPGIGDGKAGDIISYREQHGSFKTIQDIKNVSGIGENTFNRISPYIAVE